MVIQPPPPITVADALDCHIHIGSVYLPLCWHRLLYPKFGNRPGIGGTGQRRESYQRCRRRSIKGRGRNNCCLQIWRAGYGRCTHYRATERLSGTNSYRPTKQKRLTTDRSRYYRNNILRGAYVGESGQTVAFQYCHVFPPSLVRRISNCVRAAPEPFVPSTTVPVMVEIEALR